MRLAASLCSIIVAVAMAGVGFYPAHAATISVINLDNAGEGFNDPSAPDADSSAGGNPGATLGAQRLMALQYAAAIWGELISSPVEIRVGANFNQLQCDETSAILGGAGPNTAHMNFVGAPLTNTWYSQALANSLAAMDLDPDSNDMQATFNSAVGTVCAFPNVWFYGLNGNPPLGKIDFVTVALHELTHGLGFVSFVNLATGAKLSGLNDVFMRHLEDHSSGKLYPQMSNAERVSASKNTGNLHWVGANVLAAGVILTEGVHPAGHVEMYAPDPQETGASVAHFSGDLAPDQIMEAYYAGPNHDVGLAFDLLLDLGWGIGGDEIPPAMVKNLSAQTSDFTTIMLSWTAPGDDANTGRASKYDIRYSSKKITNANWSSATPVTSGVPAPAEPGSSEAAMVTGLLCGRTYYFALKTADEADNTSPMSNVAIGKTQACPVLSVGPPVLPDGEVHVPYEAQFQISGGFAPYTIRTVGGTLPQGLSFNSPAITGMPTQARKVKLKIAITDNVGAATTRTVNMRILPAVNIATKALKTARVNRSYNFRLKAKGGKAPYVWSVSGLPPDLGLTFNAATGSITGVATQTGNLSLTFQVTDPLTGTATKTLILAVQ